MSTPKASPLERTDSDLSTPVHDEIMIWLTNSLKKIPVEVTKYLVEEKHDDCGYRSYRNVQVKTELEFTELCAARGIKAEDWAQLKTEQANQAAHRLIWELPVPGKGGTIGFVDLYGRMAGLTAHLTYSDDVDDQHCKDDRCVHPECWELLLTPTVSEHYAFEVKSSIPSLGELIRQVRRYEAALPWCGCPYNYGRQDHRETELHFIPRFVVVSPDVRWIDNLVEQGIGFIEYPSGVVRWS